MRMPETCRNNNNSDNPLTSRRTDGGKKAEILAPVFGTRNIKSRKKQHHHQNGRQPAAAFRERKERLQPVLLPPSLDLFHSIARKRQQQQRKSISS